MPRGIYKIPRPAWNKGLTKETDGRLCRSKESIKKQKETVLEKYGVSNVLRSKEVLERIEGDRHSGLLAKKAMQTKLERYGDKNYNNVGQMLQTKEERYGDSSYNNFGKYRETCLQKYGVDHVSKTQEVKDKISKTRIEQHSQDKALETIIQKYGNIEEYYRISTAKRYETMKANGTLWQKESAPEKELYKELCEQYGEDDIVKQYYDEDRYPFKCDFYIKSQDKFIELQGFWLHGDHPYDKNNPEDEMLAQKLRADDSEWSKAFLYVWTDLDVRKRETAQKNGLNFQEIFWYKDTDGKNMT